MKKGSQPFIRKPGLGKRGDAGKTANNVSRVYRNLIRGKREKAGFQTAEYPSRGRDN